MIAKLIPASNWKFTKATYVVVLVAWAFYVVLTFLSPYTSVGGTTLTPMTRYSLDATVLLIMLAIMLAAARGATAFKSYSVMIAGSKEERALNLIADGLLLLLAYLVITTVFSALVPFYTGSPGFDALVVIRDHLPVAISLAAYFLLYRGSDLLRRVARFETWTRGVALAMAVFAIFAYFFVLSFTKFQSPGSAPIDASALTILPQGLVLFTLVLPFLLAWFLGILATINIFKFSIKVPGTLYKQALKDLIKGLWFVIILSMLIQFLSLSDKYLLSLKLPALLALIYILIILYGVGFMFVRAGAKRLSLLEEAG